MAKTKKVVNALSISALAGIMASTVLSSVAFAAVDAYTVKVGDNVFEYNTAELQESFLASKAGDEAVLYTDFAAKLEEAKGFYAFHDAKTNRYIAFDNVTNAFLGDRENFKLNDYVEADKAEAVTNLPAVIKAVKVVGGEIKLEDKTTGEVATGLEVSSVASISNTKLKIALKEAVQTADVNVTVSDKDAKAIEVKGTSLAATGKSIYVTTAEMVAGTIVTVNVNGTDYKVVARPAVTEKLEVSSAASMNNVEVKVTFSANVDFATSLNKDNYTLDNSLTVSDVRAGDSGKEVILTTNEQVAGKLYKLTVKNILAETGIELKTDATSSYFGGKAKDVDGPKATATAYTNTKFKITLADSSSLDETTVLNETNYVVDGLKVVSAAYDVDADGDAVKNVIVLTTASQTAGKLYTVTLNNLADKFGNKIKADTKVYFGGKAVDKDGAKVTAGSLSNTSVEVRFTDDSDMDKESAQTISNYAIEGLEVIAAELNGKNVKLTTKTQTAGKLYKVVVNNVKDEYGNVIKSNSEAYFGGKAVDNTAPTYTAQSVDNATVKVIFDDNIDKNTVSPVNFNVKELGYVISAKLESDNKTVTLTTLKQSSGKVYTLEVRDVKNTDGATVKSDSKTTFAGMGVVTTAAPKLLASIPEDNKTFTLTFDQDLAVKPALVDVKLQGTSTSLTIASVNFKGTSKNEVTVTLGGTDKIVEGKLYDVVVTGAIAKNGVQIGTDNKTVLAGVSLEQSGAKILTVDAIDNNTVKVYFDKEVKLDATKKVSITLLAQDKTTAIKYADTTAVVAQNLSLSENEKEVTIYFRSASALALTEGQIYTVKFSDLSAIQTATGTQNLVPDTTGGTTVTTQFGAVNTAVTGPKVLAIAPQSKYVVDMAFDKEVELNGDVKNVLALAPTKKADGTNNVMPTVKYVELLEDAKTVRVYLDENVATDKLSEGTIYELVYTTGNASDFICLANDTNLKAVADDSKSTKTVNFSALGNVAKGPAVSGISNVNANTLKITLDQVATNVSAANIVVKDGSTIITSDCKVVLAANGKSFQIVRANGVFVAGKSYTVSLANTVKDVSGLRQADPDATVSIGGTANEELNLVVDYTKAFAGANADNVVFDLKKADGTEVNAKEIRFRVVTDLTTAATTPSVTTVNTAAGDDIVTLTGHEAGEIYVLEATDGTVSITVVR